MKISCLYSIVRFTPYAETAEFANVGVVLCIPELGYFGYKLAPKRFPRISNFFDDLDNKLYSATRTNFELELQRIKQNNQSIDPSDLSMIFNETVKPKENILRFSGIRTALIKPILSDNYLDRLYERFVSRDFLTPQYREDVMASAIRQRLKKNKLPVYKKGKVTDELIEVNFPLINRDFDTKVIKPLAFHQPTPTKIIEHGEKWLWKINRLVKASKIVADNILLPCEPPRSQDILINKAYDEVKNELLSIKVNVCKFEESRTLINFVNREYLTEEFQLS